MSVGTAPGKRGGVTAGFLLFFMGFTNLTAWATPDNGDLPLSIIAGRIEILEVKNVGVSAADDAKSVLQIKWAVESSSSANMKSFEVVLEVGYADGVTQRYRTSAGGSARTARFEVPTVNVVGRRPAAELRQFKATVTANTSESATRIGSL